MLTWRVFWRRQWGRTTRTMFRTAATKVVATSGPDNAFIELFGRPFDGQFFFLVG